MARNLRSAPSNNVRTGARPILLHARYWIAAVAALVLYAYAAPLRGPFLFDDLTLPFASPLSGTQPLAAWIGGVRPVLMLSYWINYQISESSSFSYHLANVAFHIANGLIFFLICRRLLRSHLPDCRQLLPAAALAASIFLLHPLQTESVAYVAGRSEVLSATFVLLAWWIYIRSGDSPVNWQTAVSILVLFGLASATKEQAIVTIPAVLLLTDVCLKPGRTRDVLRTNWRVYGPLAAIAALGGAWAARIVFSSASAGMNTGISPFEYFYTQCRAIITYLRLFVVPFGQNADHDFPVSHNLLEHGAVTALIALTAAVVLLFGQPRLVRYGGLLLLAFLAPTSSLVPLADPVAEHRMYLPIAGLAIAAAAVVARLRFEVRNVTLACIAWSMFAFVLTTSRNQLWADPVLLWQDVVAKSPRKDRGYPHLTHAYIVAGRCAEAVQHLQKASHIMPRDYYILYNWARAYACANQPEMALQKVHEAEILMQTADVYALRGAILTAQNKQEEALQAFEKAIAKEPPGTDLYHVYRGHMFLLMGQYEHAGSEYRQALAVNPYSPEALAELQRLHTVGQRNAPALASEPNRF